MILGLLVPWARALATVGGIAFVVAGSINVVQGQRVHHFLAGADWAGAFVHAGNLIWLGVVLLLADAVVSGLGLRVDKPLGRRATRARAAPTSTAVEASDSVAGDREPFRTRASPRPPAPRGRAAP